MTEPAPSPAPVEPRVRLGAVDPAVPPVDRRPGGRVRPGRVRRGRRRVRPRHRRRGRRRDRPVRGRGRGLPVGPGGPADRHRRGRGHHLHDPPRHPVPAAGGLRPRPVLHRRLRRPGRAGRQPLLGPGRLQEAGEAAAVPVAPGQRLRLRRTPAVPHLLGGAHRRHHRQRLPAGGPGTAPGGHAGPHLRRAAGLGVLHRPRRRAPWRRWAPAAWSCSPASRPT